MTDHDDDLGRRLKAMEDLYSAALDSPVTERAADFIYRAHLLLRIADDDVNAAKEVVHAPAGRRAAAAEFKQLTDEERREISDEVGHAWSVCVRAAVERLWHAATVLEIDPRSMVPGAAAVPVVGRGRRRLNAATAGRRVR